VLHDCEFPFTNCTDRVLPSDSSACGVFGAIFREVWRACVDAGGRGVQNVPDPLRFCGAVAGLDALSMVSHFVPMQSESVDLKSLLGDRHCSNIRNLSRTHIHTHLMRLEMQMIPTKFAIHQQMTWNTFVLLTYFLQLQASWLTSGFLRSCIPAPSDRRVRVCECKRRQRLRQFVFV
jgi:hypothetical protein